MRAVSDAVSTVGMAKRLPLFTDSADTFTDVLANVQVVDSCEMMGLAVCFATGHAGPIG